MREPGIPSLIEFRKNQYDMHKILSLTKNIPDIALNSNY